MASTSKMNQLRKFEKGVTEKVCDQLIAEVELRKDVFQALGTKPGNDELKEIRAKAIDRFKQLVHYRLENVYKEEEIQEKFYRLVEDTKATRGKEGWRPSGDPALDTYAERRPLLVEEIQRLEKARDQLENQLHNKTNAFLELKQKLDNAAANA